MTTELDTQIQDLLEQVHELEVTIPLAKFAPATVAAQTSARDELFREAFELCRQYVVTS